MDTKIKTRGGKRENAGRPTLFKGEPKRKITLNLPSSIISLLTEKSKMMGGISRSDIVAQLIKSDTH